MSSHDSTVKVFGAQRALEKEAQQLEDEARVTLAEIGKPEDATWAAIALALRICVHLLRRRQG